MSYEERVIADVDWFIGLMFAIGAVLAVLAFGAFIISKISETSWWRHHARMRDLVRDAEYEAARKAIGAQETSPARATDRDAQA